MRGNSSLRFGGGDAGAADGAEDFDSTLVVRVEGADGGCGAVENHASGTYWVSVFGGGAWDGWEWPGGQRLVYCASKHPLDQELFFYGVLPHSAPARSRHRRSREPRQAGRQAGRGRTSVGICASGNCTSAAKKSRRTGSLLPPREGSVGGWMGGSHLADAARQPALPPEPKYFNFRLPPRPPSFSVSCSPPHHPSVHPGWRGNWQT